MKPRLEKSRKWTALPAELCRQIQEVFVENFAPQIKNGKVIVEGRIYSEELLLRVGYLEAGRLKQANFEVSLDFTPNKQNGMAQIHFAVDVAATLMHAFFTDSQDLNEFPQEWSLIEIDKMKAYVQVSTINSDLESEANKLLGQDQSDLVQSDSDQEESEDMQAVITMLGLDKEDSGHVHGPDCKHNHDHDHSHDQDPEEEKPTKKRLH